MVSCASIREGLKELYSIFGIRVEVNVQTFSFLSEHFQQQQSTLQSADIFWFAGVHVVSPQLKEALSRTDVDDHVTELAAHVRRRVQYDHMTYVGVCGGANMASSPETCVYECGLDLLQGLEVCQAWNNDANILLANYVMGGDRLAFTTGCALAVVLKPETVAALCFPVIKNAGRLWGFAATNTQLMERVVQRLGNQWKQFATSSGDFWFFNLRGYYRFSNCDELHLV